MGRGIKKKSREAKAERQHTSRVERENASLGQQHECCAASASDSRHIPVLFEETLNHLLIVANGRYLDGTLGLGGHAEGLLQRAQAQNCPIELLGLDRDTEALVLAGERLAPFGATVHTAHQSFSDFAVALDELGWKELDGALIDIGVSSLQIDTAERGFSFIADGPLDMRMNTTEGTSAWTLANKAPVATLKKIIEEFGEDPMAGRIARAIDDARAQTAIDTTMQLARIVENAYPAKWRATSRNHPATRTFQAFRMVVNDELGELSRFLEGIVGRLRHGGRVAVITFHSLEDRMVKHFFREQSLDCICPAHIPVCTCNHTPSLRVVTKKPVLPTAAEIAANGRAGSAKLRVAERLVV